MKCQLRNEGDWYIPFPIFTHETELFISTRCHAIFGFISFLFQKKWRDRAYIKKELTLSFIQPIQTTVWSEFSSTFQSRLACQVNNNTKKVENWVRDFPCVISHTLTWIQVNVAEILGKKLFPSLIRQCPKIPWNLRVLFVLPSPRGSIMNLITLNCVPPSNQLPLHDWRIGTSNVYLVEAVERGAQAVIWIRGSQIIGSGKLSSG